jgi:hypothetical protein
MTFLKLGVLKIKIQYFVGGWEIQVLTKNLRQSAQVSVDKVRASSDFWQSTLGSLVLVGIEIHKVLLIRQVL